MYVGCRSEGGAHLVLLLLARLLLVELNLLGELIQVDRALREGRLARLHVLKHRGELRRRVGVKKLRELILPGVAVRGQRLLQRRAVDADKADVADALL